MLTIADQNTSHTNWFYHLSTSKTIEIEKFKNKSNILRVLRAYHREREERERSVKTQVVEHTQSNYF